MRTSSTGHIDLGPRARSLLLVRHSGCQTGPIALGPRARGLLDVRQRGRANFAVGPRARNLLAHRFDVRAGLTLLVLAGWLAAPRSAAAHDVPPEPQKAGCSVAGEVGAGAGWALLALAAGAAVRRRT